ncbi:MAG TPA: class I SAM-dependent methyltransferase [Kofleriaceae bacterium]
MGDLLHEQNRKSWNHATIAHNSHKGDQAAFLRGGGSTLFPEELALLGDLVGQRLLHLQCNAGQDTLSLVARGAIATGVDISDEAIAFANRLSMDSGLPATFDRADVYDWLESAPRAAFDRVFSSYGAIAWLSDLPTWARGIAQVLAPGGRLVVLEFHPELFLLAETVDALGLAAGPTVGRIDCPEGVGDYVADSREGLLHGAPYQEGVVEFQNPESSHEFGHTLGSIIDAIARAGLVIEQLSEYPYSNGCKFFTAMIDLGQRRWALPPGAPSVPLMFGLCARRPVVPR